MEQKNNRQTGASYDTTGLHIFKNAKLYINQSTECSLDVQQLQSFPALNWRISELI